jgi:hypothetical protein
MTKRVYNLAPARFLSNYNYSIDRTDEFLYIPIKETESNKTEIKKLYQEFDPKLNESTKDQSASYICDRGNKQLFTFCKSYIWNPVTIKVRDLLVACIGGGKFLSGKYYSSRAVTPSD